TLGDNLFQRLSQLADRARVRLVGDALLHFFLRVRRFRGFVFSASVPWIGATRSPITSCAGGDCRYAIARSKYSMSSRALPSVCLLQRKQSRPLTRPVL